MSSSCFTFWSNKSSEKSVFQLVWLQREMTCYESWDDDLWEKYHDFHKIVITAVKCVNLECLGDKQTTFFPYLI